MPLLACRNLTRRPYFADRSFAVEAGEILVIWGPSGSGKSLFLRTLADLDPADAGEVFLEDAPRPSLPPEAWRAAVLYVHQSGVRLPGTVRQNLDRIAALGIRKGADRPWPAVPGLAGDLDAERLSGGEAQALALHRALACGPRVLLLDEATSALDPDRARQWEGRIRAYAEEGGAVLWVSHDDRLAARLGARRERFA